MERNRTQESSLPFTLFVQIEAKTRNMNNFKVCIFIDAGQGQDHEQ